MYMLKNIFVLTFIFGISVHSSIALKANWLNPEDIRAGVSDQLEATLRLDSVDYNKRLKLLKNKGQEVPLGNLEEGRFALVLIGAAEAFASRVNDYMEMPVSGVSGANIEEVIRVLKAIEKYDRPIIGITEKNIPPLYKKLIVDFVSDGRATVVFFGGSDELEEWDGIEEASSLMLAGGSDTKAQDFSAQALFGAIALRGRLEEPVSGMFQRGEGVLTDGGLRLKYSGPYELGINGERLASRVDSIVNRAMAEKAFPGCQILMAVDGTVVFRQSYGYHTYQERTPVINSDLYDLASVTKIAGPLPLIMQLNGAGILDLDAHFSNYWADWKNRLFRWSDKDTLTLRQLLSHQARLVPYINFWSDSKRNGKYKRRLFRFERDDKFQLEVDDHLFLRNNFKRKVYRAIRKSNLLPDVEYRYSGLGFMVYPEMLSRITGGDYEKLLYKSVFKPLGASRIVYNPLKKGFTEREIPPTEDDQYFRKTLVHGRVHDEAAAVLGGISGNAGLFGNANDLAKLMQLYLNRGSYGGRQLIPEAVMDEFIKVQFPENENRRALGFDKPLLDNGSKDIDNAYPAPGVSPQSFGHGGYTGTFVWVDPDYEIVYVFLSNRVFPSRSHDAIYEYNVRTSIQQVLYDEMKSSKDNEKK